MIYLVCTALYIFCIFSCYVLFKVSINFSSFFSYISLTSVRHQSALLLSTFSGVDEWTKILKMGAVWINFFMSTSPLFLVLLMRNF